MRRLLILTPLLLNACGTPRIEVSNGCLTVQTESGVVIRCPGQQDVVVSNGTPGPQGSPGPKGNDGLSVVSLTTTTTTCKSGGVTTFLATDQNSSGKLEFDKDTNISSFTVCNGDKGEPSPTPTPSKYTPVAVIDPCGDKPGVIDEVLLRLNDGSILASVSDKANGQNTRFAILPPNNYMTTDGSNCYFTITTSGDVINERY